MLWLAALGCAGQALNWASARAVFFAPPTLGAYPSATVAAGGSTTVMPAAAPTSAVSTTAYTSAAFKGLLTVNPTTGVVSVMNAQPAGTYTITVKAFNAEGTALQPFTLTVTGAPLCWDNGFTGVTDVTTATTPLAVVTGDFDGDGKLDLVTANAQSSITFYKGSGAGGYSNPTNSATAGGAQSLAAGDFNGDGRLDVAAAHHNSNTVSIRLGNGAGGFTGTTAVTVGANPTAVALGDFNNDGKLDLLTANSGATTVSLRLGDGAGGFTGTTNFNVGFAPYAVAVGDFNGDGNLDYAVAQHLVSSVEVHYGNGAGGMSSFASVSVSAVPRGLVTGDFNGDGRLDFATANYGNGSVSIRLKDATAFGFFSVATDVSTGGGARRVAAGDFNADGKLDLAAANETAKTVSLLRGDGAGGIASKTDFTFSAAPYDVTAGDFNTDGKLDFAAPVPATLLAVRFNTCNTAPVITPSLLTAAPGGLLLNAAVATVRDGESAAGAVTVTLVSASSDLSVNSHLNTNGVVTANITVNCGVAPGRRDVVLRATDPAGAYSEAAYSVDITANPPPTLSYNARSVGFGVAATHAPASGPADNGGVASVAIQSVVPTPNAALTVNAAGVVSIPNTLAVGAYTVTIRAMDNCGALTDAPFTLTVLPPPTLGNYPNTSVPLGNSVAITPATAPVNTTSAAAYTASTFKGTFTVNPTTGVVRVMNAQPAGTYTVTVKAFGTGGTTTKTFTLTVANPVVCNGSAFTGTTEIGVGAAPYAVATGDFDNDGKLDLATVNSNSGSVSIRLGDGAGGFSGTANVSVGGVVGLATGDFNGDGNLDFITVNVSGGVAVRLGNGAGGFSNAADASTASSSNNIFAADFNGDGKLDFATTHSNGLASGFVAIRLGDGAGGFSGTGTVAVGSIPTSLATGDFDGDGDLDMAVANTGGTTVSIRTNDGGGNFSGTTEVTVGSGPRTVETGNFDNDNILDLVVANQSSNSVSFRRGNGAGGFSGTTEVAVGNGPFTVTTGDFDGDGKLDFAATNFAFGVTTPSTVSVRLGNGLGAFSGTTEVTVGVNPRGLAAGDFNGDSKLDLAVSNQGSNSVSIRLNNCVNRGPTITALSPLARTQGSPATNVALATVTDPSPIAQNFSLSVTAASLPPGLTVSNINVSFGFVLADVAATCAATAGINNVGLTVTNTINGLSANANLVVNVAANPPPTLTYTAQSFVFGVGGTVTPATGPADNGSIASVTVQSVVPAPASGTPTVNAAGVVTVPNNLPAGSYTVTMRAADNCGTTTDAAFTLTVHPPPTLGMYANTTVKAGQNTTVTPSAAPTNTTSAVAYASATFSGVLTVNPATGALKIMNAQPVGTHTITVKAFGNGGGTAARTLTLTVTSGEVCVGAAFNASNLPNFDNALALAPGDFNNDGHLDFALSDSFGNIHLLSGNGAGGFSSRLVIAPGSYAEFLATGDFNGDGKLDLLAPGLFINSVTVLLGDGAGGLSNTAAVNVGSSPTGVVTGDFNGDGKLDFAAANSGDGTVSIRLGNGAGGFTGTTEITMGGLLCTPRHLALGDFNGDGRLDFATANLADSQLAIRLGDGAGGFSGTTTVAVGTEPLFVAAADFNSDGFVDLAAANYQSNTVSIRLGSGDGTFRNTAEISTGAGPNALALGDFNGDGRLDFASANYSDDNVSIRLGNGAGGFSGTASSNAGLLPNAIVTGDLNGDGKLDFAVANNDQDNGSVTIALSNCAAPPPVAGRVNALSMPGFNANANLMRYVDFTQAQSPLVPGFTALTVEAWVKLGSATGRYDMLTRAPLFFNIQDGKPALWLSGITNPTYRLANAAIPVGVWTHVAATWDGTQIQFYINGAPSGTHTVAGTLVNETLPLVIGYCNVCNGPAAGFLGELDEIRLWKVVRTQAQLQANQFLGLMGWENGLEGYWRFDENSGTTVVDATGHGFDGTLNAQVTRVNGEAFTTNEDTPFSGRLFAYRQDSLPLTYTLVGQGGKGTVTITNAATGAFTYTPNANANGADSFTFRVSNSQTVSNTATVNVTLNPVNDPPTIAPVAVTRTQASAGTTITLATVSDPETPAGSLTVTAPPTLPTGISISNISNTNGTITATVAASCAAALGANIVVLTVSDGTLSTTANLTINVAANTPPVLVYNAASASLGNALTINPASTPSDNGNITGFAVQSVGTYTGGIAVNNTTGVVTLTNPAPVGTHTLTIRATDNCGAVKDASFSLRVVTTPPPTLGSYPNASVALGNNVTIAPSAAPANTNCVTASTTSQFKGVFTVNPTTGIVRVTNAQPAGTYLVTVKAINNGVPATAAFTLTVGAPLACLSFPTFNNTATASAGLNPYGIAAGDFDNDGKLDVAVANGMHDTDSATVRFGDGAGGFTSTTVTVPADRQPFAIAAADFNGDGNLDLAVGNTGTTTVSIRLGNGAGGFGGTANVDVELFPFAVAAGDFNGDGKPDFAAANFGSNTLSIRLGDGAGNFADAGNLGVGDHPKAVATGDFNRDGALDLAVANDRSNNVSIRLGNGAGGFTGAPDVSVGDTPAFVAPGDFNADGKLDLAVVNQFGNSVSIRLGDGAGNFSNDGEFGAGDSPIAVATGDFDGDGKLDLVITSQLGGFITLLRGNGLGGFTAMPDVSLGGYAGGVVTGDFNGDQKLDFAVTNQTNNTVALYRNACNTAPAIAAQTGLTRPATAAASTSPIATVSDAETAAGSLTVTITSANPANGVTLSNLVNTNGRVTASIATSGATTATFTLRVSDGVLSATATLTVTVANTCNAIVTSGNWNAPATWGCGGVPGAGAAAIVQSGQQVTLNTNPAALASLAIQSGATLALDANRTLAGNLTLNNQGTLALNGFDLSTGGFTLTLTGPNCPGGSGDIVGTVSRSGLTTGVTYCFNHADNTVNFTSATFSTPSLTVNLSKGSGVSSAVARVYTITPSGISGFSAALRLRYLDSELNGLTESELRLYRYNGTNWEDKGGTHDASNNHVTATGITAFSPWVIGGPSAPTAVTLVEFSAALQPRGGVALNWRTGYEADCLGFNVYRESNGERVKLTSALVAGSALQAAGLSVLSAGNGYRWTDARGAAGAGYWLEEVDLRGASSWFGPVYAAANFAESAAEASPLLHELNAAAEAVPREWLMEETAPAAALTVHAAQADWTLPNQDALKLSVKQTGWYRVTAAELQAAGFSTAVNPLLVQLYADGVEVPMRAYGKGNTLDAIEFYGQALDTPATDTRVYWLTAGPGVGARWRVEASQPNAAPNTASYRATVERRERLIYFSALLNGDADNWFGPVVSNTAAVQTLTARFIDRAATATLEVTLQGVTEQAHAVNVELNGQYLGTANFSGRQLQRAQFQFAATRLRDGANEIRCQSTAGASDINLLDTLRLHYARGFVAEGDTLRFRLDAGQSAWIGGFSTASIRLLELGANGLPARELTVKPQAAANGFGFALQSAAGASYLAISDANLLRAAELKLNTRSNWRAKTNAADFVIVTHRAFLNAANRLAQARRAQELRTIVVEVEDAYDEFSFGAKSPQAIKDLLTTARTTWLVKPRFALFIGDATYDPRNYLGMGEFDFLPTKLGATYYFETALDNWFADANDDGLPELALGRLPVRTATQADALVTKLLAFKPDSQLRPALLVSDRTTEGVNFAQQSQQYAALLPALMVKQFINRQDGAPEQVRAQIINTLNQNNPLLVNWAGHGSTQVWTGDGLLRTQDAPTLTNRAPGLFVMATCLNGFFTDPQQTSLGEAVLLDTPGGAFGVIASSALNFPAPQHAFSLTLYQRLFSTPGLTLGEATTAARLAAQDRDVRNSYVLFGDPTLKLR